VDRFKLNNFDMKRLCYLLFSSPVNNPLDYLNDINAIHRVGLYQLLFVVGCDEMICSKCCSNLFRFDCVMTGAFVLESGQFCLNWIS